MKHTASLAFRGWAPLPLETPPPFPQMAFIPSLFFFFFHLSGDLTQLHTQCVSKEQEAHTCVYVHRDSHNTMVGTIECTHCCTGTVMEVVVHVGVLCIVMSYLYTVIYLKVSIYTLETASICSMGGVVHMIGPIGNIHVGSGGGRHCK